MPASCWSSATARRRPADRQLEPAARARGVATRALALGRRTDVYVAAPRACAARRSARDRARLRAVRPTARGRRTALKASTPAPSIVIASGSGTNCHAYWPLRRSRSAATDSSTPTAARPRLRADPASARRRPHTARTRHPVAQAPAADHRRERSDRLRTAASIHANIPRRAARLPPPVRTPELHPAARDDPLLRIARGLRRGACWASRSRAIARWAARSTPTARRACTSTRPRRALVLLRPLPPRLHHLRPRRAPGTATTCAARLPPAPRRPRPALGLEAIACRRCPSHDSPMSRPTSPPG